MTTLSHAILLGRVVLHDFMVTWLFGIVVEDGIREIHYVSVVFFMFSVFAQSHSRSIPFRFLSTSSFCLGPPVLAIA